MTDELALLLRVADTLNQLGIRYFVSGSVASMHYGEPRFTRDIDIVIHLRMGDISALIDAFPEPEFYISREAILQALETDGQFNVIQPQTGLKVDFMCAESSPYTDTRFRRARAAPTHKGVSVTYSAPEDVILMKLRYFQMGGSDKHLRDIASIIKVSGEILDREYLDRWAASLGVAEEWAVTTSRVGW